MSAALADITILAEGLLPAPPLDRAGLSGLARLVERGQEETLPTLEETLLGLFATGTGPAALSLWGASGQRPEGRWALATPVHFTPRRRGLLMLPPPWLDIAAEEAQALATSLSNALEIELAAPIPGQWYLRCDGCDFAAPSPAGLAGHDLDNPPLHGPGAQSLRLLASECELLLAGHPVNQRREEAGQPAINGLWFWGQGELPNRLNSPFAAVCADHPLARGLALAAGLAPAPAAAPNPPCPHLRLASFPPVHGESKAYQEQLATLEKAILRPAADSGLTVALGVFGGMEGRLYASKGWRRRLPWKKRTLASALGQATMQA